METVISLAPDVIVDIGEMGETPADSDRRRRQITERLWQRRRWSRRCGTARFTATTDEAFVVPGPRIVDAAECDGELVPRSATVR